MRIREQVARLGREEMLAAKFEGAGGGVSCGPRVVCAVKHEPAKFALAGLFPSGLITV